MQNQPNRGSGGALWCLTILAAAIIAAVGHVYSASLQTGRVDFPRVISPAASPTPEDTPTQDATATPDATPTPDAAPSSNHQASPPPTSQAYSFVAITGNIASSIVTNAEQQEKKGLLFHNDFTIRGAAGVPCHIAAVFYERNEAGQDIPLKDTNGSYGAGGSVSVVSNFTPPYNGGADYRNYDLFIPYDELELSPGNHTISARVIIWPHGREAVICSEPQQIEYHQD